MPKLTTRTASAIIRALASPITTNAETAWALIALHAVIALILRGTHG
jgi:hypothetical protein